MRGTAAAVVGGWTYEGQCSSLELYAVVVGVEARDLHADADRNVGDGWRACSSGALRALQVSSRRATHTHRWAVACAVPQRLHCGGESGLQVFTDEHVQGQRSARVLLQR